jgi:hypothetical protein
MKITRLGRCRVGGVGQMIVFGMALAGFAVASGAAQADPSIKLDQGAIVGADDTISATRIPVTSASGRISYVDITLPFLVDGTGRVTLNTAGVTIVPSPRVLVGAFRAGRYLSGGGTEYLVGTPGTGPGGGRVTTSIQAITSTTLSANWVSGPIAGHPYEARLRAANITSTAQTWGIVQSSSSSILPPGAIIGAVQSGDQLTLTSFGSDNIPDSGLTLRLCPPTGTC